MSDDKADFKKLHYLGDVNGLFGGCISNDAKRGDREALYLCLIGGKKTALGGYVNKLKEAYEDINNIKKECIYYLSDGGLDHIVTHI